MDHLINITDSLRDLNNEQIIKLGAKLGLSFPALQRMKTLPEDMVAAWLREEDKVTTTSGPPSWTSLVTALEAVGQMGIASKIRKGESGVFFFVITSQHGLLHALVQSNTSNVFHSAAHLSVGQ